MSLGFFSILRQKVGLHPICASKAQCESPITHFKRTQKSFAAKGGAFGFFLRWHWFLDCFPVCWSLCHSLVHQYCVWTEAVLSCRINSPLELTHFPEFPLPPDTPMFVGREVICNYLSDYARHFGLFDYIKVRRWLLVFVFSFSIGLL